MVVEAPRRYHISADQLDKMVEAGIIDEGAPVELLEGELVEMPSQGLPHVNCVRRLNGLVHVAGIEPGTALVQSALRTAWDSQPEPDLVLLKPPASQYDARRAGPEVVLLLVEVAHSSRDYDRSRKVPHYARVGIAEVWLVDLDAEIIKVYRDPVGGAYRSQTIAVRGATVTSELFPSLTLEVDQILGPTD